MLFGKYFPFSHLLTPPLDSAFKIFVSLKKLLRQVHTYSYLLNFYIVFFLFQASTQKTIVYLVLST